MMALGSRSMQELLRENLLAINAEFAAFANFHLHLQEDLKEADKIEEWRVPAMVDLKGWSRIEVVFIPA